MKALRVAVVGAGPVGRAVARAGQASGDSVVVGVRDPADSRYDPYRAEHDLTPLSSLPEADVTVLAVPGDALPRAFTTVGWENFTADVGGGRPDLLWSGPGGGPGHATVAELITHTGMRPVWVGEGEQGAAVLDQAARLWFGLAMGSGFGRHLALQVLRDSGTPG